MAATPVKRVRLNRGEQKEQRTQQLLDAAWELFCEKGYDALTIDEVAEHAGYSRKPIYSLFGDKQTLFFELWLRLLDEMTTLALTPFEHGAGLRANLKRLAAIATERAKAGASLQGESLFFVVQTIALSRPDLTARVSQATQDVLGRLAQAIKQSTLADGEKLRGKPEQVAAHLVAHINGLSMLQFQTGVNYMRSQDLFEVFVHLTLTEAA
ncbi:TetR/AcrR family transcriptional regulator [Hydrocarboniphaga sp.]|uniref:TetR/AcrR family transcriptional regulator n=1 Tax=Hydrocarboniphaga sp. TaxID=2033016 RepID=UPI003D11CEC9